VGWWSRRGIEPWSRGSSEFALSNGINFTRQIYPMRSQDIKKAFVMRLKICPRRLLSLPCSAKTPRVP